MSASDPASFTEYWQNLPIPWLVGGKNGQADATSQGTVVDQQVSLIKQATKAHMPGQGPADALPHSGGDRQLEQGPAETNQNFITRIQTAWDDWARAGTALELLVQLFWGGFPNAVIVQQNGLAYSLSGSPTAGQDPTSLLTITTLGTLGSSLTPVSPAIRTIPAGNPWWTIDSNTNFCSRFAVLFPGLLPSAFRTSATATFTGAEDGFTVPWPTATWNNPFPDTTYKVQVGAVYVTDGAGIVTVVADATTKTQTSIQIISSAPFTGTVDVLAWQAGANPMADLHPADLARLRRLIFRWRPEKATCTGIVARVQGNLWGWPVRTWNNGELFTAGSTVVFSP